MADLEKVIAIIFEGDDRTKTAFQSVTSGIGSFATSVEGVADKVSVVTDGVIKMDAALATLAAAGLTYSYLKAVEFESAVVELTKVVGVENVVALDKAKAAALDLSSKYGVAASDILLSVANFKQAGFEVDEAIQLAGNSLDLVIAGGVDAAQSSEILISALKGFQQPASEAGRLIDILNEVSNKYATDVEQLATGMAALSPIARTMGFSMEETAGILTPVIEIFRSGDEAANALKTGLLKLIDDSAPVRDALASIGVSQTDANGALKSGKEILFEVATAFTGLDQNQKLFVASQLVGIEQSAKMVEVFDNLGKVSDITAVAMGAAGSASTEVAARLASAEVQLDRFKVGFENLAIVVGTQFKDAATSAVSGATDIENALQGMVQDGTFKPIFDAINKFATDLGKYLSDIAKAMPEAFENVDFGGFTDALGDLVDAASKYLDGLDLTNPEDLATAMQHLVDMMTGLVRVTEGMVDAFRPYAAQVADFLLELSKGDAEAQKFAGELLATAKVISSAGIEVALALRAMQETGTEWGTVFSTIGNAVAVVWNGMVVAIGGHAARIIELVSMVVSGMDMLTFGLSDGLSAAAAKLDEYAASIRAGLIDNKEGALAALSALTGGLIGVGDGATDGAGGLDTLGGSVDGAAGKMGAAQGDAAGLNKELDLMPSHKGVDFEATGADAMLMDSHDIKDGIEEIPDEKTTDVAVDADTASIDSTITAIEEGIPEEKETSAIVNPDEGSITAAGAVIDESIPDEKDTLAGAETDKPKLAAASTELDTVAGPRTATIEAKADEIALERLKGQFELMQAAVEWEAKLDIAEVEANAKIVEAIAGTLSAAFSSSADIISSALGAYAEVAGWSGSSFIESVIERELSLREEAMALTKELTQTQIDYMREKMSAMESGEALIQIDGAGLQPHLEAFMWEILGAIQVRVNEEGHAMLFGI